MACSKRPSFYTLITCSPRQVLEENERSIHDALCVVRSLFKKRCILFHNAHTLTWTDDPTV